MAGEVFIARQDTLETVKGTVDGIDSGVKQTNNALGNFSGGGTDTVKTELQTLKDSVAQLQTKSDQLQSLVEQLMNKESGGWSNFKITDKSISGKNQSFTYTTSYPAIVINADIDDDYGYTVKFNIPVATLTVVSKVTNSGSITYSTPDKISFVPKGTIISCSTGDNRNNFCNCIIAEFI